MTEKTTQSVDEAIEQVADEAEEGLTEVKESLAKAQRSMEHAKKAIQGAAGKARDTAAVAAEKARASLDEARKSLGEAREKMGGLATKTRDLERRAGKAGAEGLANGEKLGRVVRSDDHPQPGGDAAAGQRVELRGFAGQHHLERRVQCQSGLPGGAAGAQ